MNRKQRQVQRHEKQLKHHKSLAERKQLAELSRKRRSEDPQGGRKRNRRAPAPDDDDPELFEKMKAHRGRPKTAREVREDLDQVFAQARGELEATVLAVHRGRLELLLGERRESVPIPTSMSSSRRGRFAVGDRVTLTRSDGDALRVATLEPRTSEIARPDPADPRAKHVLAANVDRAVVVTSTRSPAFKPGLVERFLIVFQRGGVAPLICLNKVDLAAEAELAAIRRRLELCRVPRIETSTTGGIGLAALREALAGQVVVFVGQSGVGKSSLVNALRGDSALATGDVRARDGKGRHTTTRSDLFELEGGTRVIDTPGIRSLGLWEVAAGDLADEFPEFAAHAAACRFGDCLHAVEPACGVRDAAERGDLPRERYEAYLRILESLQE